MKNNLIILIAALCSLIVSCSNDEKTATESTTESIEKAPVKSAEEQRQEIARAAAEAQKSEEEFQRQKVEKEKKYFFSFTPKKLDLSLTDKKNDVGSYYDGDNSFYDGSDYLFAANVFSGLITFIDSSGDARNFHNPINVYGITFLRPDNKLSKENWNRIVVERGLLKEDGYTKAKELYNFIINNSSKLLVSYVRGKGYDDRYYTRVSLKKTGKIIFEETSGGYSLR